MLVLARRHGPVLLRDEQGREPDRVGLDLDRLDISRPQPSLHTDIPRLRQGMVGVQFWSVYIPANAREEGAAKVQLEQMDIAQRIFEASPELHADVGSRIDGFVRAHAGASQNDVMGYHTDEELPNYWRYADRFTLHDRMFAPVDSWTLPAHLFLVSGWSAFCPDLEDPMSCESELAFHGDPKFSTQWSGNTWDPTDTTPPPAGASAVSSAANRSSTWMGLATKPSTGDVIWVLESVIFNSSISAPSLCSAFAMAELSTFLIMAPPFFLLNDSTSSASGCSRRSTSTAA